MTFSSFAQACCQPRFHKTGEFKRFCKQWLFFPKTLPRERVLAQRNPQPELRIEVADGATYQSFAGVLADAKAANIEKIGVLDNAGAR